MKILLLLLPKNHVNPLEPLDENVKFLNPDDVMKTNPTLIDKHLYSYIKIQETKGQLEKELRHSREILGIPLDGFTPEGYRIFHKQNTGFITDYGSFTETMSSKLFTIIQEIGTHSQDITDSLGINQEFGSMMTYLILYNAIFINASISISSFSTSPLTEEDDGVVKIVINNRVTKRQLIEFIEDRWSDIEKAFVNDNVPHKIEEYISPRDFLIMDLRDMKKMKFREIADKLSGDNPNLEHNEDQVKTAYHSAKKIMKR